MSQRRRIRPAAPKPLTAPRLTPLPASHEPSAWLVAAVTDRLVQLRKSGLLGLSVESLVVPLGTPAAIGSPEDFQCDRCGHREPDDWLRMIALTATLPEGLPRVVVYGGLCRRCAELELLS